MPMSRTKSQWDFGELFARREEWDARQRIPAKLW
jgi:hypothetical protein